MNALAVSTDYLYEFEGQNVMIRLSYQSGSAMVEFYVNNRLVYYKPATEVETEISSDYELIKTVLSKIHGDKDRWMPGYEEHCDWLLFHFEDLVSTHRICLYKTYQENRDIEFRIRIEEYWDGNVKFQLTNSKNTDKISCSFNINSGPDLLSRSAASAEAMTKIFHLLEENQSEMLKATFSQNVVMSEDIV